MEKTALRLCVAVAQADGAVEDWLAGRAIRIGGEIALTLELDRLAYLCLAERRLEPRIGDHFQRIRIEVGHQIAARAGISPREERVIETNFRRQRSLRIDPVDR